MKSLPRYDSVETDPHGIRSKLNQFGNSLYETLWMQNGCPQNIVIADQHLECQGPLKNKRFGNPVHQGLDGKPWDGVHMRGPLAKRHYTNSLRRILAENLPSSDWSKDYQSSDWSADYHKTCAQTRYQARQRKQQNLRDYHHSQRGSPSYRHENRRHINRYPGSYNYNHTQGNTRQEYNADYYGNYNVRVSNRFNQLGNY